MPSGTSAIQFLSTPTENFRSDPSAFFGMTEKSEHPVSTVAMPALGQGFRVNLPNSGIVSRVSLTFVGELVVTVGGATASKAWPYGLLSGVQVKINSSTTTWDVNGQDLYARRFLRNPAYREEVDLFPGAVAGGAVVAGTYPIYLTYEIDLAADETSLIGAYYLQSSAVQVAILPTQAVIDDLFSANADRCSFTGNWTTEVTEFTVPRSSEEGNPLLIPDLSRVHMVTQFPAQFSSTNKWLIQLPRDVGQLHRLICDFESAANTPISALPGTAAENSLDQIGLHYGNNHVIYEYNPAARLLSRNNNWYNAPVPYERLVFDFIRENAPRDIILQAGITNLTVTATPNSAVAVTAGAARVVRETLIG